MVLARDLVRPLRTLEDGAERIRSGDYDVVLPVRTRDEFGDLTEALNAMSEPADQGTVARRAAPGVRPGVAVADAGAVVVELPCEGEETIAQDHDDVTVLFAEVDGLDELADDLSAEDTVEILNRLVRQFDAAAEERGVEKVRTLHNGYVASCGLHVPRLDNVRRTVDLAAEMARTWTGPRTSRVPAAVAGRYRHRCRHQLRGRAGLAYDMWGEVVNLVYLVQSQVAEPGVYVTGRVVDGAAERQQFRSAGDVVVDGAAVPIWRLVEPES